MNKKLFKNIKLLILDVDGVMTDGKIGYSESGSIIRFYNVLDGFAINNAIKKGFKITVISGAKTTKSIINRCYNLGIKNIYLEQEDKLKVYLDEVKPFFKIKEHETAFIGDDVFDIDLMKHIALPVTVPNAVDEVKKIAKYITNKSGGDGAIREIIDLILL